MLQDNLRAAQTLVSELRRIGVDTNMVHVDDHGLDAFVSDPEGGAQSLSSVERHADNVFVGMWGDSHVALHLALWEER